MSLILEALNRARREQHNAAPVPGVDSEHYYPGAEESPWRQRGLLAVLAVALLVIGVLLGREFSRDGAALPTAAPVQQTAVQEAPASLPVAAPAASAATAGATGGSSGPERAQETPEAAPEPASPEPAPAVTPAPAQLPPAMAGTEAGAEVAALYQKPTVTETPAEAASVVVAEAAPATEEPLDIASLVTAAEQALEDGRLAEHPAPFLADLSQQRKDAVPTLMYLQHDYRAAGGSTVTINGQQAGAGQTVGRGVKIDEILPDSVVLSHAGQQFRLRALNSWVNL